MSQIAELQRQLANVIRIATVVEIDHGLALARLESGENETDWLPWPEQNAAEIFSSNPPKIGECWVILSPGGELENAVMALRLTSDENPHLENDGSEKKTRYPDGTEIGYNHETHTLSVTVPESGALSINVAGSVNIAASDKAVISAPEIDLGASGLEPSVLGEKLAAWVSSELKTWLDTHTHIGNLGAPTSPPTAPFSEGTAAQGGAVYSQKNRNQ